jgi:hypothetical protein
MRIAEMTRIIALGPSPNRFRNSNHTSFQREMHPLMAAVLFGMAGFDTFDPEA